LFGNKDEPEEAGYYKEAVRRGGALLTLNNVTDNDNDNDQVEEILMNAGAVDIETRASEWKANGFAGHNAYDGQEQKSAAVNSGMENDSQKLVAVEKSIELGKRVDNKSRVRIYTRTTETPYKESINLRDENVVVERHAVNRPVTSADFQEETIELTETTERPVVAKTARVVEEVSVSKVATDRTETVSDTLHGTKIEVDRDEKLNNL
jgi:stress response protein YsnF